MIEIREYIFTYIPWDKNYPIRSCSISIVAENRKEAELIALKTKHNFFDQDCTVDVKEGLVGYKR